MTRGDFVIELLGIWEQSAAKMKREGYEVAASEIGQAIQVLEKTYTSEELKP